MQRKVRMKLDCESYKYEHAWVLDSSKNLAIDGQLKKQNVLWFYSKYHSSERQQLNQNIYAPHMLLDTHFYKWLFEIMRIQWLSHCSETSLLICRLLSALLNHCRLLLAGHPRPVSCKPQLKERFLWGLVDVHDCTNFSRPIFDCSWAYCLNEKECFRVTSWRLLWRATSQCRR